MWRGKKARKRCVRYEPHTEGSGPTLQAARPELSRTERNPRVHHKNNHFGNGDRFTRSRQRPKADGYRDATPGKHWRDEPGPDESCDECPCCGCGDPLDGEVSVSIDLMSDSGEWGDVRSSWKDRLLVVLTLHEAGWETRITPGGIWFEPPPELEEMAVSMLKDFEQP
jgi:hypothetical protein